VLRSISGVTRSLNRADRDHVNHLSAVQQSSTQVAPPHIAPTQVSNYHFKAADLDSADLH
ncbi:MAG TPA: hypothetical protein VK726_23525, partial [Acetobacteraceae bacterium]|nr:hypothetical protein [Acetobacteraceae bacterium]